MAKLVVMSIAIPHVVMLEGTPTTTPHMITRMIMLVATPIVTPTTTFIVTTTPMAMLHSYAHDYAHKQLLWRLVHQKDDITHYKYFLP